MKVEDKFVIIPPKNNITDFAYHNTINIMKPIVISCLQLNLKLNKTKNKDLYENVILKNKLLEEQSTIQSFSTAK